MPRILNRSDASLRKHRPSGLHPSATGSGSLSASSSYFDSPQSSDATAGQRLAARLGERLAASRSLSSQDLSQLHHRCLEDGVGVEVPLRHDRPGPRPAPGNPDGWGFFVDFAEPLVSERHFLCDFTGPDASSSTLFPIGEK